MIVEASLVHEFVPTGRLRASLNMANVLLAQSRTSAERPAGVTVDLSRELASRLGVEVTFLQSEAPGDALTAVVEGQADVAFLAVEPKRAQDVYFTAPYVQIDGCYLACDESPLHDQAEVDRPGNEVIVIGTSAYDLYLTRTLKHATIVRMPDAEQVLQAFLQRRSGRSVVAGIKQALLADAARMKGVRLLQGNFMAIMQAIVLPRTSSEPARAWVKAFVEEMTDSGFVAASLERHAIQGATVVRSDAQT